jgi:peroxidase
MGRRDGRISSINNVNLPGPGLQDSQATAAFTNKGLTLQDMVILLGTYYQLYCIVKPALVIKFT